MTGGALRVIEERLAAAAAARACHACGCLHQTVAALEATDAGRGALAPALAAARRVFVPRRYDCLGCAVCHPALAADAFGEAFPAQGEAMAFCPTEAPAPRAGWPPLPGDYRVVRAHGAPVAVCTLDDEALADRLAALAPEGLAIVGTMRTENLGIERVVQNTLANPDLRFLVLCGEDGRRGVGHLPGQSMQSLFSDGVDGDGRIRGAKGRRPVLKNVTRAEVDAFVAQVELVALVGEREPGVVVDAVRACAERAPGPFRGGAARRPVRTIRAEEPARLVPDPFGYLVIFPDPRRRLLVVEHVTNQGTLDCVVEGRTPAAVCAALIARGLISRLDHAAYAGQELARAQRALETGEPYVQDRAAGEPAGEAPAGPTPGCGCGRVCGEPDGGPPPIDADGSS